jgi:hypothetical protein
MSNFKEISVAEMKGILSSHRNDDETFSEALGELLSRNCGAVRYPANLNKKYSTFSCGAGGTPASSIERARTPVPQDWIIYFLESPKKDCISIETLRNSH